MSQATRKKIMARFELPDPGAAKLARPSLERGHSARPRRAASKAAGLAGALAAWFVLTTPPARAAEERPRPAAEDAAVRAVVAELFGDPVPARRLLDAPPSSEPGRGADKNAEKKNGAATARAGGAPARPTLSPEFAAAAEFARAMAARNPAEFQRRADALLENEALPAAARESIAFHLDRLPSRLAGRLRSESRFNVAAEAVNALLSAPLAIIQGNGVAIGHAGLAIGRLFGRGSLTPRERKELLLLREESGAGWAGLPELERASALARLAALEERHRAERADFLEERAIESLRFHAYAEADFWASARDAATNDPPSSASSAKRQAERGATARSAGEATERSDRARLAWRRGRGLSLTLAPDFDDARGNRPLLLAIATRDSAELLDLANRSKRIEPSERDYLHFLAAALRGRPDAAAPLAERLAAREDDARDRLAAFAREARRDATLFPLAEAERQRDYYEARVRHFALTGSRDLGEHGYLLAYGAIGGATGLTGIGVFYGLDSAIRWIATFWRAPLPPEEAVDAAVRAATSDALPPERRALAMLDAAELRAWAGEARQAHALATRAAAIDPSLEPRLEAFREEAALELFRQVEPRAPVERRRGTWRAVVARYPGTDAAAKAEEKLAALPPELPEGVVAIAGERLAPGGDWRALAGLLPIDPRLLDGDAANGEVARLLAREREETVAAELLDGATLPLPPDASLARLLVGRVRWEEESLRRAEGFHAMTRRQYLPLRVEGGIGGGGVDASPQLKTIPFREPDAHLYRR
jgi:hypothetical protein